MAADAKLLAQIELVGDIEEWIVDATCDPDCDAYRGANGSACARCEALFIANKLTESGRLLPSEGEVRVEWVMRWRHPSSSRLDQTPTFGSEERARQVALSCAKYGGVDVSVHRRDVHVWSDGTHLIGPWSPVLSDNSEASGG